MTSTGTPALEEELLATLMTTSPAPRMFTAGVETLGDFGQLVANVDAATHLDFKGYML